MKKSDFVAIVALIVAALVLAVVGVVSTSCARPYARVAQPLSTGQVSASEYSEAETEFSGGPIPTAPEWTSERCQHLMDTRDGIVWASVFGAALGAGGGLGAVLPEDASRDARLGVGISAAVVAAAVSAFAALAQTKSREFEEFCRAGSTAEEVTP
jgi:drug/metabolite transporter (DMT)-like permease